MYSSNLLAMVDKPRVTVADIGCGPHAPRQTKFANGVVVDYTPIDKRDYPGADMGDMENLVYPDKHFDIVVCENALDHTKYAERAVKELIRVAKSWVYIDCALDQLTTSGKGHYWDAKEDGTLTNGKDSFDLKDYGFKIEYINNHGARRYNHIIARKKC